MLIILIGMNITSNLKKVSKLEWLKEMYFSLKKIRKEEDYLFFKMNEPIFEEIKYYRDHFSELKEIITILDDEYAVCGYHELIECLIEAENAEKAGISVEYLIDKDKDYSYFYAFPEGTLEALITKQKKDENKNEALYI